MRYNKKLSDIAEISVGFPFQSRLFNQNGEGFRLIRGKNVGKGFLHWGKDAMYYVDTKTINKNYVMQENDVVLAMDGNVVENKSLVRKKDLPSYLVQRVARLRAKDGINQLFLWYVVNTHSFEQYLNSIKTGTTIQHISAKQIGDYRLDLPDLETQKKIVRVLSAFDKKIELINYQNHVLEGILQCQFNDWIRGFEPIGEVGLDKIAKYTNGLAMQKYRPKSDEVGLPVIKIKEMNSGLSKGTERCTGKLKENFIVFPGDVLFAWSGTLCVKIWDGKKAGLNQHIFKITSDEYPKWFYYLWTKKHLVRFINIAKGKATTMGHIQRKELSISKALIPNRSELARQDRLFAPLLDKIILNNSQKQSLVELHDTLFPRLMLGEVDLGRILVK
ncbi:restriction endonuclease subunit S [Candidatus Saccharibacteria bacterium]|nr:restriction endonuclease subunit S [Candidatus Saccharibacteria bacterium]